MATGAAPASAPVSARGSNKRSKVKLEPQPPSTGKLFILQMMRDSEDQRLNSETSDGDVLVEPWMFDKVFRLT